MNYHTDRPARRPTPCPRCGVANGWKRVSCQNPACGVSFRIVTRTKPDLADPIVATKRGRPLVRRTVKEAAAP